MVRQYLAQRGGVRDLLPTVRLGAGSSLDVVEALEQVLCEFLREEVASVDVGMVGAELEQPGAGLVEEPHVIDFQFDELSGQLDKGASK